MVRFTRSMKAVFSRPEKPIRGLEALRAASVPRRITCATRISPAIPIAFFHLAIDQVLHYLPLLHLTPLAAHLAPVAKMGRESIEIHIQTGQARGKKRPNYPPPSGAVPPFCF